MIWDFESSAGRRIYVLFVGGSTGQRHVLIFRLAKISSTSIHACTREHKRTTCTSRACLFIYGAFLSIQNFYLLINSKDRPHNYTAIVSIFSACFFVENLVGALLYHIYKKKRKTESYRLMLHIRKADTQKLIRRIIGVLQDSSCCMYYYYIIPTFS